MDKFLTSIIFLGLLYIVKLLKDYYIFKNDPDCFNFHEKFQDSKATYMQLNAMIFVRRVFSEYWFRSNSARMILEHSLIVICCILSLLIIVECEMPPFYYSS